MDRPSKENFSFQKVVVIVGIVLFLVKMAAWFLTKSVAILTDTLESIINVIAGLVSLYSLYISAKPKDRGHPYGHGKIEFISAGIEGGMIALAGAVIIYESIQNIFIPKVILKLDYGIILIAFTGLINYILGYLAVNKGKKNNSLALISSGEHLKSDTYSTVGLVIGLGVIFFTKLYWLDSAIAIVLGTVIIVTGYRITRKSLAGIMDEVDTDLIKELVIILEESRSVNWIDIHNVRIIKYGSNLHLDCHITMPWYFNLKEVEKELSDLESLIKEKFDNRFEMFVIPDSCEDFSCKICQKQNCPVRKHSFRKRVVWTIDNIEMDRNHQLEN